MAAEEEHNQVTMYLEEMVGLISTADEEQNKRGTAILAKAIHQSLVRRLDRFKNETKPESKVKPKGG